MYDSCNSMDGCSPGFSVLGVSQTRMLEWVPFPSPGDLPDPGIEPESPALAGGFFTTESPGQLVKYKYLFVIIK